MGNNKSSNNVVSLSTENINTDQHLQSKPEEPASPHEKRIHGIQVLEKSSNNEPIDTDQLQRSSPEEPASTQEKRIQGNQVLDTFLINEPMDTDQLERSTPEELASPQEKRIQGNQVLDMFLIKEPIDTDKLQRSTPEELARLPEKREQHISEKPTSKEHTDFHQLPQVISEEASRLPEKRKKRKKEKSLINKISAINLDPQIEEKQLNSKKISRNTWFEQSTNQPPQHWKKHIKEKPSRDDLEWFFLLLTSYNQHQNNILEILSTSNWTEETVHCPSDINDEAFDDFARKLCSHTDLDIPFSQTKAPKKQQLIDCINKCHEKKLTLIKLGKVIEEHNRLKLEVKELYEKNIELQELRFQDQEEISCLKKHIVDMNDQILCQEKESKNALSRIQDQIEREKKRVRDIQRQLQQMEKEKEHLLTRLSKIAGSKLTSNNPDIADLNDDNRPTKLAEKFGQLYDDAWTDSIEELTRVETGLNDREAISSLLRITMTAYQFCSGSRAMFLDLTDCQTIMTCKTTNAMKAITKLPDAITPDIQQATKMGLRARETTLISQMQEKFADILNGILSDITRRDECPVSDEHNMNPVAIIEDEVRKNKPLEYCLHDVRTTHLQSGGIEEGLLLSENIKMRRKKGPHSESSDFLQPLYEYSTDKFVMKRGKTCELMNTPSYSRTICPSSSPQFEKTTHFGRRCVELCWFMQTTHPPIHLSASIPDDGIMKNDTFRAYLKSGREVDYIVWPVMYLYENGPVLKKGVAQPK